MAVKFADVSAYQPSNEAYFKGLKDDGAKFCWVKLSEGSYYVSPSAGKQLRACKKVFGNVGVYHFWHGESPAFFLAWLKEYAKYVGFKLSDVKVALDVEASDLPLYVTNGINKFEEGLVKAGIKPGNIWTYISSSWIKEERLNIKGLKYGFIWASDFPYNSVYADNELKASSPLNPGYNAWQFSGLGSQDWSYDYTGTLDPNYHKPKSHKDNKPKAKKPVKKDVKKPTVKAPKVSKPKNDWKKPVIKDKPLYANHPSFYKTDVDKVGVYSDFALNDKLSTLPKGYTFFGAPILNGHYTRLLTRSGNYVTGNLKFIKLA